MLNPGQPSNQGGNKPNALVHRAIEEQQSIRAGDCAIPFQGSISFYYYVGDTSALPDGINEDTVEEYQNAFKSA